jgi:hypothetical protein
VRRCSVPSAFPIADQRNSDHRGHRGTQREFIEEHYRLAPVAFPSVPVGIVVTRAVVPWPLV